MSKHIGIIAVSPEGTALCYRHIFRAAAQVVGDRGHPTVTIHNEPLEAYIHAVLRDDWHAVGELLVKSARVLEQAGADFCIVPDNIMQHAVHLAETEVGVPMVSMTDFVAEALERDGCQTVGLIGTKMVMLGSTYQTHLGLRGVKVAVPNERDINDIDSIIFRELLFGVTRPESKDRIFEVIDDLSRRGCEGVILAYSEASLYVTPENAPVPVYDSTSLLAEGAVRCAVGLRDLPESR